MKPVFFIAALFSLAVFSSCEKELLGPGTINSNSDIFDPALFKQNIIDAMGQREIGYCFVINYNGQLAEQHETGNAIMSQDGSTLPWTIDTKMNIASVTKWLTAMGAMQLMDNENIELGDMIFPYLPQSWEKGPGIEDVSFADLLTHSSGLTTSTIRYATDYNSLKTCIATGVVNNAKGYNYSNVNFALFRIMFKYMEIWDYARAMETEYLTWNNDTTGFDQWLADEYLEIMQEEVFDPAGVSNARMDYADVNDIAKMYSEINPSQNGSTTGDWTLVGGGGGYYLSPKEIAAVLAYLYHSDDLLTVSQIAEMESNRYGLDSWEGPMTDHGQSYGKGGALFDDINRSSSVNGGDNGLETKAIKFPGGVEIVFFVNALGSDWGSYQNLIADAYDDAWVEQ